MSDINSYRPVIGLEIHIQLKTKTKLFGSAPNQPGVKEPNVNIDEIDTAQPGTLPVLNQEAVRLACLAGLAFNCEIPEYTKFDRKHYFYPDLPKGYQISQYDEPINKKGYVDITLPNGTQKRIGITRAHLEEDAGKNMHPEGQPYSLVDYNRAGCPLLEIVTDPDIESAEEAKIFLKELQSIVRYIGASDCDMEKGTMRCEPNISVRRPGETGLPKYKVEVKNINSFTFAENAIKYEIVRQTEILEKGETPEQVTMGWNEKSNSTVRQRSKEEANDYRYFPDPDLPILHITQEWLSDLRHKLPELPNQKRARFYEEYKLPSNIIETLIGWKEMTFFFEEAVSELDEWLNADAQEIQRADALRLLANWCSQDFAAALNSQYLNPQDSRVTPEHLAELVRHIAEGKISGSAAKQVFKVVFEKGATPSEVVSELGLEQVSDTSAIEAVVEKVLLENQKQVESYKAGNEKLFGFFVGQTMKELQGKGNPGLINDLLKKRLG